MRRALLFPAILFACALPCALHAQSTEADLKARLLKKPLFLRDCWRDDKLTFDATGKLIGKPDTITFTLAGIEIDSVKLKPDHLQLSGHRVGLVIEKDIPRPQRLDETIQIEIASPANLDYSAPLDAIFTPDLKEVVLRAPSYWQSWTSQYILHTLPPPPPGKSTPAPGTSRVGGNIKAPVPIKMPDPSFSKAAHDLKFSGKVLVYLQVDEQGKPTHLRLIRPRGLGLDEMAISAASAYEFKPATQDGKPITVELNVEISFDVY